MPPDSFEWLSRLISQHGLWLGSLAALLGGLTLNFTPCVYPMIPVTLAFFGQQGAGAPRRAARLAALYVLGISVNYAFLGVVAAKTGSLFGAWLQQPGVLISLALVVGALALGMFGLYELRLPAALAGRLGRASSGPWGAFVMGLIVGLVAAPCIGPFVLGLLLVVGQLGSPAAGFLLFFMLGLGLGLPYVALGIVTDRAVRLPQAGPWLLWCKHALGCVLLGLALYFLRPLLPSWALRGLAALLLLGAGLYLGWLGRAVSPHSIFQWVRRLVGAGLLFGAVVMLWPAPGARPHAAWVPFSPAALEDAARQGRPALVDVYADWCVPCVEMDHVTFRHPDVVQALAPVVTLRLDVTREVSAEGEVLLERYRIYGAPTLLFFDRAGRERRDLRLLGFAKPGEFLERLRQIAP